MFIEYDKRDAEKVRELLKDNPYQLSWGEKSDVTILVVDGKNLIGVGSLWKNDVHPYRDYIGVYVHPNHRQRGIGKKLFNCLLSRSQTKQLQTAVSSKDKIATSFLQACGFVCARKCYTPVLRKENISVQIDSEYLTCLTFGEATREQKEEVLNLQLENYKEFHQAINPLNEKIPFDDWKKIILDGLNQQYSFVLVEEGEIEATVLCYEDDGEIEIGYVCGKDSENPNHYRSFYQEVIEKLFMNFETVSIEADDVDPFAFTVLNYFSYDPDDSWDTYIFQ